LTVQVVVTDFRENSTRRFCLQGPGSCGRKPDAPRQAAAFL